MIIVLFFFFQAEDGIRDRLVAGSQTCALPMFLKREKKKKKKKKAENNVHLPAFLSVEIIHREGSEERRVGKECRSQRSHNH